MSKKVFSAWLIAATFCLICFNYTLFAKSEIWHHNLDCYDDNWQFRTVPVDKKGPWGIVYRTWQCQKRALRHEKKIVVYALTDNEELKKRILDCLGRAAVAGLIANIVGDEKVGTGALLAMLVSCVGRDVVEVKIEDRSHWTNWANC